MSRASCWMMTVAFRFAAIFLMRSIDATVCGAVVVERGHAVRVVVLAEVHGVAAEDHGARLRQLDQQAVMARRVPGRAQHDHAAVAEHILVERERLDLALALDPALERLEVHALGRLRAVIASQSPLPISTVAFGNEPTWPV